MLVEDYLILWQKVATEILSKPGIVLIIGENDTGKSTFVKWLTNSSLGEGLNVALVDADIGQSDIGPPTTISLAVPEAKFEDYSEIKPASLYFVGSTSPSGNLLACIIGTRLMTEKGKVYANTILINTTGMVAGGPAVALKQSKIECLSPTHIVVFQRNKEIEPIISPYKKITRHTIHCLPVAPGVKYKTPEERRAFRERKFNQYFQKLFLSEFSIFSVGISGVYVHKHSLSSFKDNLVGLYDEDNELVCLGKLDSYSLKRKVLLIYVPFSLEKKVCRIHISNYKLSPLCS